jgi:hypothetical protein
MRKLLLAVAAVVAFAGCSRPDDQKTESIGKEDVRAARTDPPPELIAQLDSGNAAYKAKDYEGALRHYRSVTRLDADMPAGWFGIYMSEEARGNRAAADSALRRAQKHAPGASLINP